MHDSYRIEAAVERAGKLQGSFWFTLFADFFLYQSPYSKEEKAIRFMWCDGSSRHKGSKPPDSFSQECPHSPRRRTISTLRYPYLPGTMGRSNASRNVIALILQGRPLDKLAVLRGPTAESTASCTERRPRRHCGLCKEERARFHYHAERRW
jgi:hypothetical protein